MSLGRSSGKQRCASRCRTVPISPVSRIVRSRADGSDSGRPRRAHDPPARRPRPSLLPRRRSPRTASRRARACPPQARGWSTRRGARSAGDCRRPRSRDPRGAPRTIRGREGSSAGRRSGARARGRGQRRRARSLRGRVARAGRAPWARSAPPRGCRSGGARPSTRAPGGERGSGAPSDRWPGRVHRRGASRR